jgi:prolyl-tRNA editing enzyme YbaK/EbsC (Cys-tRNA(Pro) deacylase)
LESGAKALLLKVDNKFIFLVLSAALKFNSKAVKKIFGAKSLRFADISEVKNLTVWLFL